MTQIMTWDEFKYLSEKFNDIVNKRFKNCKYVYGIPRGGKIISVLFSHNTKLTYLENITNIKNKDEVLIVDDINDTGLTFSLYEKLGFNNYFSLFKHIRSVFNSNEIRNVYNILKTNEWIIFPWENNKSEKIKNNTIK